MHTVLVQNLNLLSIFMKPSWLQEWKVPWRIRDRAQIVNTSLACVKSFFHHLHTMTLVTHLVLLGVISILRKKLPSRNEKRRKGLLTTAKGKVRRGRWALRGGLLHPLARGQEPRYISGKVMKAWVRFKLQQANLKLFLRRRPVCDWERTRGY